MIVINPITRQFSIPGADLVFGVEADSGAERKYFQCPRFVGNNVDVASSFVRINYRNASGEVDAYLIEDLRVDGDNVLFSWALHPKVTMYKGQISFVMCVTGPDAKLKWHTTMGRGQVLEGLEPDGSWIHEGTEDAIVQLITMVEKQTEAVEKVGAEQVVAVKAAATTATATAVAQIEAKGTSTLATIPEDYTTVQNAVRGAANAIRGKASGEVIRVDDVSPAGHYPAVRVAGKNIFNIDGVLNDALVKNDDGTYTLRRYNGYRFSNYMETNIPAGTTITVSVYGLTEDGFSSFYIQMMNEEEGTKAISLSASSPVKTTSWDRDATKLRIYMPPNAVDGDYKTFSAIQVEIGDTATEYVPYIDPTTISVVGCGKNLFPLQSLNLNQSSGKGTVENGILTITGHLLSHRIPAKGLVGKNCVFSCKSSRTGEKGGGISVECKDANNVRLSGVYKQNEVSPALSFVVAKDTADIVLFFYSSGSQEESATAIYDSIQLEVGNEVTRYDPYEGGTYFPSSNGRVEGVKAVYPTTTIFTNTPGVSIECEYNRDTNKVIEEILNKITALGG